MIRLTSLLNILSLLGESYSTTGVIWNKAKQAFVPIFDVGTFRDFERKISRERLAHIESIRHYNYEGEIFKLNYFELSNMVHFVENDTKITGLFAETWNILSKCLNFTIKPIKEESWGVGKRLPNGSYTSILGKISRNEIDIIPRARMIGSRLDAMKMIAPIEISIYRFYIKRRDTYGSLWMIKVFSWDVWLLIAVTHLFLTIFGFLSQKRLNINTRVDTNLIEHYFYNFAIICNQGFIPINFRGRPRIFEFTLIVFAQLITMAFSAMLITYLTQKTFYPPFNDMEGMMNNTDYDLVILNNSYVHLFLQSEENEKMAPRHGRYVIVNTLGDICKLVCSNTKNFATIMSNDEIKSVENSLCTLHAVGQPWRTTHVTSGLRKDFKCVECINSKVLRIREIGIFNSFYQRWSETRNVEELNTSRPEPITMQQVFILFSMVVSGALLALALFIIETIVFNST